MRTKTLLIAAATLVVGIISPKAQVYSPNVVGYYTYISQTNAAFEMVNSPLDDGTNTLISLYPAPNGGTQIQLWNGSGFLVATFSGGSWKTNGVGANNLVVIPGTGFFIKVGGTKPLTNTFVGNVTPGPGNSVTNTYNAGLSMVGSVVPFFDYITNGATIGITNVPGATQIQTWNIPSQSYTVWSFTGGQWKTNGVNGVPFINIGQGFFLSVPSGKTYKWQQTEPN